MKAHEGWAALLGAGLLVSAGITYLATRSAGPLNLQTFTETRAGPLVEQVVTREELGLIPAGDKVRYPAQVAPGITSVLAYGFAPLYKAPDPVVAALPGEAMW